jgi:hypothetical protein
MMCDDQTSHITAAVVPDTVVGVSARLSAEISTACLLNKIVIVFWVVPEGKTHFYNIRKYPHPHPDFLKYCLECVIVFSKAVL